LTCGVLIRAYARGETLMQRFLPSFGNIDKITVINFLTRFHFYLHISTLFLQQQRGLDLLQISIIESVVAATIFLAEVPTGVIADRIGRKWTLVLWSLFLMIGELMFLFSETYPQFLLMALFTGIGHAFGSGARDALVYDSLPAENREVVMQRVMGRISSWGQLAFFASPIIGAFIVGDMGLVRVQAAIALTAGVLGVGALIALTLREPDGQREVERPGALAILRSGLADLHASPALRKMTLITVLTIPFTGILAITLAPPYLEQNDVSPFAIGMALSVGNLLAAFTQRYAYKVETWLGAGWGMMLLSLLPGISYLLLALIAGPIATWSIIVWMYATNDMRAPLLSAYQNAHITSGSRATALSLMNMFVSLFAAFMGPLYAALATTSLPLTFVVMGGVIVVASLLLRPQQLAAKAKIVESAD
jgi:predicted MFS family arabinose efflux permease